MSHLLKVVDMFLFHHFDPHDMNVRSIFSHLVVASGIWACYSNLCENSVSQADGWKGPENDILLDTDMLMHDKMSPSCCVAYE